MARERKVRLEASELAWLCEQVALVQKSGIPLPEGIDLLAESSDMPRLSTVLNALSEEMKRMIPLSEAMDNIGTFPPYLVNMAKIGELSGNLDKVMESLSQFYVRDAELRRKLRGSLIYPLVLLVMMLGVIVLLVARVLPVFSQILTSFGTGMPAFSQGLLSLGIFISSHWVWLLPAVVIAGAGLYMFFSYYTPGRNLLDKARLKLPVLGPLFRRVYASRFSASLSYMLRSAIDMDTALLMTESIMDNSIVARRIAECRKKIAAGEDTFKALQETDLFPRLFIRMLSLGNRTGDLDTVMQKIAGAYESEVDSRLSRMTGLVEPLLVLLLSLIVGAILLTVMLPLVEIMATIG